MTFAVQHNILWLQVSIEQELIHHFTLHECPGSPVNDSVHMKMLQCQDYLSKIKAMTKARGT